MTIHFWRVALTIRLACPSVCLSVGLSVCLSINISLVGTITQQILIALGPNLYHGCILGVSWLSSKMDDRDLFFEIMGSIVNTITPTILVALGPNLYHGCILGVSWLSSKVDDRDLFFEVMGVDCIMKFCNFRL